MHQCFHRNYKPFYPFINHSTRMSSFPFLSNPIQISGLFMTSSLTKIPHRKIMYHDHVHKGDRAVWSPPFWEELQLFKSTGMMNGQLKEEWLSSSDMVIKLFTMGNLFHSFITHTVPQNCYLLQGHVYICSLRTGTQGSDTHISCLPHQLQCD